MYSKKVGAVTIKASDGWPVSVSIAVGDDHIGLTGSDELRDLQYAVERALEYVAAEEKRGGGN